MRRIVWGLCLAFALVIILIARPAIFLVHVALNDRDERRPLPPETADDASRLDATHVEEIWEMPASDDAEIKLRDLLARAKQEKLAVSIAGARHSMGGQTIYPGGIQIDMLPYHRMSLDEQNNILDVQAGARWAEIIPFLDSHGRSVAVMQSNNSFTVGGSLSVNCHGWQPNRPPIASTVESFRLMQADGTILQCSRSENPELFSLALGGYGLFGVILDAQIRVVPNERYKLQQYLMPSDQFIAAWDEHVTNSPDVGMALGRLSVVPDDFLKSALLYTFTRDPDPSGKLPPLSDPGLEELSRVLFRGSVDSDYGKKLRWEAETTLLTHLAGKYFSRNQLQNEPVELLENRSADSTDILQECFVPRDKFADFISRIWRNLEWRRSRNN
jgi:FAD/FMN-containing dehydrogenase